MPISQRMLATCRKLGITFGNALPVLSQLAHSRILHQLRFKEGTISGSDWDFRLKQPMNYAGPLNLRPYLDQDWYKSKGGNGEICISISYYNFVLPSLPTSYLPPEVWDGEFPPFDTLLSKERFLHRSRMIRQQTLALVKHPLFVDITACYTPARVTNSRNMGLSWRAGEPIKTDTPKGASVAEDAPFVVSNGGASIGNVSNRP